MSRHSRTNGVPDRWLDYKAVGKRLHGTRFIAFKVPLKQSLTRQLPCSDVFGPWDLLDALSEEKQELGLIIDLTFTTRYYNLRDVPESLLFVKIFTAGHEVPSDDTILSFKRTVRRFLRDNADNDKLIGVHCTHGLNRTGYLICRYLIDVDGMDPKEAVDLFNTSRGHAIERPNYIDDLHCGPKRSNEGIEECGQEPTRGHAARRPPDSDRMEERRPHLSDSRHHRAFPPRGTDHRPHRRHQYNGLLPTPPLLPPPHYHPYRWVPPHHGIQYRGPPWSVDSRSRRPEPEWSPSSRWKEDRGRGPPSPPPPPFLPRYSPRWTSRSNSHDEPEEAWADSRTRHDYRHRVNTYDSR